MTATMVVVRDYQRGKTNSHVISNIDKDAILARWNDATILLDNLQSNTLFQGSRSWGSLNMTHYHVLIALHLSLVADLSVKHQNNFDHPVTRSLRMILTALVTEIESRLEGCVSQITIHRISETTVQFDMSASLSSIQLPSPRKRFRIVVNNTE